MWVSEIQEEDSIQTQKRKFGDIKSKAKKNLWSNVGGIETQVRDKLPDFWHYCDQARGMDSGLIVHWSQIVDKQQCGWI